MVSSSKNPKSGSRVTPDCLHVFTSRSDYREGLCSFFLTIRTDTVKVPVKQY